MHETAVREYVACLYSDKGWARKVARMPSRQVYAIFRSRMAKKMPKKQEKEEPRTDAQLCLDFDALRYGDISYKEVR